MLPFLGQPLLPDHLFGENLPAVHEKTEKVNSIAESAEIEKAALPACRMRERFPVHYSPIHIMYRHFNAARFDCGEV